MIIRKYRYIAALLTLIAAAPPTDATEMVRVKISAGTGFYINQTGDIVTNAHVVRHCQSITIPTAQGDQPVSLRARDDTRDLAVLHSAGAVPGIARFRRDMADLHLGDSVAVPGYPGASAQYVFRQTTLTSLTGPTGEPHWLQLAHVAEHGNSGGPVLDTQGNVIAVMTGKALTYRVNASSDDAASAPQLLGQSDIAITLPSLQYFLHNNNVLFDLSTAIPDAPDDSDLETTARQFTVPIRCIL